MALRWWKRCKDNGYIYKKSYKAKYCVGCESEKTDSELDEKDECPLHPGKEIEFKRLRIEPAATLCTKCVKKMTGQGKK